MNRTEYKSAVDLYLDSLPSLNRSECTLKGYRTVLTLFHSFLEQRNLNEITPLSILKWRNQRHIEGTGANTISHNLMMLHTFFKWCKEHKLIDTNPINPTDIPKQQKSEYNLLTLDEINAILRNDIKPKGIFSKNEYRNRAIVVLAIQSGIRNSELRALKLSDVDFEQQTITVQHGKGDKRRVAPFPKESRQALKLYLESGERPNTLNSEDLLFGTDADENGQSTGGKVWHMMSSECLLSLVNRYTRNVCGHSVGVHALRHAYASLCDHYGIGLGTIQKTMGHSSPITTSKVYIDVLHEGKAASVVNEMFELARA